MSKGIIVANLTKAEYRVKITYDYTAWNRAHDDAVTAEEEAKMAMQAMEVELARLINAEDAARGALNDGVIAESEKWYLTTLTQKLNAASKEHSLLRLEYNRSKGDKLAAQKRQLFLLSNKKPDTYAADMFCLDYTVDLPVGTEVGLVEINNENPTKQGYYIHPNRTHPKTIGTAAYSKKRDGAMVGAAGLGAAQVFYNLAMFTGWQRWRPLYRLAKITAFDTATKTAVVLLDDAASSITPEGHSIDINSSRTSTVGLKTYDIPVWEGTGLGFAKAGEKVVVKYLNQDPQDPVIISRLSASGAPIGDPASDALIVLDNPEYVGVQYSDVLGHTICLYDAIGHHAITVNDRLSYANVTVQSMESNGVFNIVNANVPASSRYAFATSNGVLIGLNDHLRWDAATHATAHSIINTVSTDVLYSYVGPSIPPVPSNPVGTYGDTSDLNIWRQQGGNTYARVVSAYKYVVVSKGYKDQDPPVFNGVTADSYGILSNYVVSYFREDIINGTYTITQIGNDIVQYQFEQIFYRYASTDPWFTNGSGQYPSATTAAQVAAQDALVADEEARIHAAYSSYDPAKMPAQSGDSFYPILLPPRLNSTGIHHAWIFEPTAISAVDGKPINWTLYQVNGEVIATDFIKSYAGIGVIKRDGLAYLYKNGVAIELSGFRSFSDHVLDKAHVATWWLLGRPPRISPNAPDVRL